MAKEDYLKDARDLFPEAENDVVAVDEYARQIYSQLQNMPDKECEKYFNLAAKYRKVRQLYEKLYKQKVEQVSAFKKVC